MAQRFKRNPVSPLKRQVPTGAILEPDAFEAVSLGIRTFLCDACGKAHVWEKRDATVSTNEGPDLGLLVGTLPEVGDAAR